MPAREGQEFIEAEVIEGHVRAPISAGMSPQELLLQVEYAEFLRRTDLDRRRPKHDIRPTALGRYDRSGSKSRGTGLVFVEPPQAGKRTAKPPTTGIRAFTCRLSRSSAIAASWSNSSDRTEADIYLWVMRHRYELEEREGHDVGPVASAVDYAEGVEARRTPLVRLIALATRVIDLGAAVVHTVGRVARIVRGPSQPPE